MTIFSVTCGCQIGTADIFFGQSELKFQCYICGRILSAQEVYGKIKGNFLSADPSAVSRSTAAGDLPAELKAIIDAKHPQFSGKWRLSEFDSFDFSWLLAREPAIMPWCNLSDFSGPVWEILLENDWKCINSENRMIPSQNPAKAPASAGNAKSQFTGRFQKNLLDFDEFQHPAYLAVYNLLKGKKLFKTVSAFPDLAKRYLDLDKISGLNFLELLAADPVYAESMTVQHWQTIVRYVKTLAFDKCQSVKTVCPKCGEQGSEIIKHANPEELSKLDWEEVYTLIDFMDWEWNAIFDWSLIKREDVLDIAVNHPEFAEKYGWDKFTSEELIDLGVRSAIFMSTYGKKILSKEQIAKILEKSPIRIFS